MIELDRIVTVVNPVGSQITRTKPRIDNILAHYASAEHVTIETQPESEATIDSIATSVREGDVLAIAGGDGTFHDSVEAVLRSKLPAIALLPLWGGNGNDMSHMLNGNPRRADRTHELLRDGALLPIHPIALSIDGLSKLAASYAGFGFTAAGAHIARDPTYRAKPGYHIRPIRALREAAVLSPLLVHAKPFIYTTERGTYRSASDITFANGNRMAKYGRPSTHLELPELFHMTCRGPDQAAEWVGRLLVGRATGSTIRLGEHYSFTPHENIRGHVDAETFEVQAGSEVCVTVHDQPFFAVHTK